MRRWRNVWWWWLVGVAVSFASLEFDAIIQGNGAIFTLSDTIRRWSYGEKWLAPLVIGTTCGLLYHFFGEDN